jgi:hypothetical protein
MHGRLRQLLVFAFCGILALTGQIMAVARGSSAATGEMVLCTGSGPVTIYTDGSGKPTAAPHICPDCLTPALSAVLPDLPELPQRTDVAQAQSDLRQSHRPGRFPSDHQPRAPPLIV